MPRPEGRLRRKSGPHLCDLAGGGAGDVRGLPIADARACRTVCVHAGVCGTGRRGARQGQRRPRGVRRGGGGQYRIGAGRARRKLGDHLHPAWVVLGAVQVDAQGARALAVDVGGADPAAVVDERDRQ
uniref:hypothetical protein n=1 Tax=Corynebacterium frankenforstense TaxID=1230998 RepID=UPI0026F35F1C